MIPRQEKDILQEAYKDAQKVRHIDDGDDADAVEVDEDFDAMSDSA